jgi:hypothetical protein
MYMGIRIQRSSNPVFPQLLLLRLIVECWLSRFLESGGRTSTSENTTELTAHGATDILPLLFICLCILFIYLFICIDAPHITAGIGLAKVLRFAEVRFISFCFYI